eukprot:superscaffoldBa00005065_g19857
MHVAGAVASQWWDRALAQKRSLLRQHMAIEECGLRGGRSSTCVAWRPGLATPPKTADNVHAELVTICSSGSRARGR